MRKILIALAAMAMIVGAVWFLPPSRLLVGGVNIGPWLLPGVMTIALVEGVILSVAAKTYDWSSWFASSGVAVGRELFNLLPISLVGPLFAAAWAHRIYTMPLGPWWSFALIAVAQDFCFYWMHRSSHHIRWLWATHSVHHSPNEYTLAAAYRLGWTSKLSGDAIFNLPLVWLGFRPDVVAVTVVFNLLYQFWLHTELVPRLGWLEWVFNTPAHHRVHHACNPIYLDKNFGGVLIVFDRLFGTFADERPEAPQRYGLVQRLSSYNPLRIVFHEWMSMVHDLGRARSLAEGARCLFGAPGWTPAAPRSTQARPGRPRADGLATSSEPPL
jgi:sterol desaturase/sphingolipid hydroxylase (fatty acid hydroxylase superfamily)